MDKMFMIDADRCGGCQICELICSMEKFGEYNPEKSHIKVLKNQGLHINIPVFRAGCDLCGKCVEWCLEGAIEIVPSIEATLARKEAKIGRFPALLVD
jgi:carbon-monoxide dehydrogenase iron sulfur subunit